ncbi:hypothetical protein J5N97_014609 [Dioscorea zingiberensis]|uniref:Uncharacterized protein n=1 Tax=Dioscorea zingiberensis TaxID=325984 RepID=A0A9D5CVM3_9LILI|nr:hypothetical protein J5N97_014609 [Dioscorea zingiberensis]
MASGGQRRGSSACHLLMLFAILVILPVFSLLSLDSYHHRTASSAPLLPLLCPMPFKKRLFLLEGRYGLGEVYLVQGVSW